MKIRQRFRRFKQSADWSKEVEQAGKTIAGGLAGGYALNWNTSSEPVLLVSIKLLLLFFIVVVAFAFYSYQFGSSKQESRYAS